MKHDSRKTYSGRFTDSVRAKFNEVSEQFPDYTDSQIVESICNECEAAGTGNDELQKIMEERDSLILQVNELTSQLEEMKSNIDSAASVQDEVESLKNQLSVLSQEKESILTEKEALSTKIANIGENDVLVSMNDRLKLLLDTTVERLNKKYNVDTITAGDLLKKMFIRYTVEQCIEWFYPFVLSDSDIVQITGVSMKQWENYINNK